MPCQKFVAARFHSGFLFSILFAFAGFSVGQHSFAQYGQGVIPPPEELRTGFDSINDRDCAEMLGVLAGPVFEGRGTGQPGYMKAAHWVAGQIAATGLEPMGEGGTYFQMMQMRRRVPDLQLCRILCPDGTSITAAGNFGLERFTDQYQTTGQSVFLSLSGPDAVTADPAMLRDKIVFYSVDADASRNAARMIARCGPAASFRIIDAEPRTNARILRDGARTQATSVSGTIRRASAEQIASSVNGNAAWAAEPTQPGVTTMAGAGQVTIQVQARENQAGVPNVVAWLEGSDPELRHEYVVIGAHLDHLGTSGGAVFPGADDNGSGSTAVLSIARAMMVNPVKPRRSVLFMWFAAEEIGLVGSKHYVDHPLKPLENMTCMLNIDMVGRNEASDSETGQENEGHIHLVGSLKGNSELNQLIQQANQCIGFEFEYDEEDVFGRSDQINFYRQGVPVAFLFGGFHPDYHQPTDRIEQINFHKITSAARLYYIALHLAAEHGRFQMEPEQ